MSKPSDFIQGTLDLLILKTLTVAPQHGWSIAQMIKDKSEEVLQVQQGSLYPALHKLETQGFIDSEWGDSDNNRRAKYYSLTKKGRKYLAEEEANWHRLSRAVSLVVSMA